MNCKICGNYYRPDLEGNMWEHIYCSKECWQSSPEYLSFKLFYNSLPVELKNLVNYIYTNVDEDVFNDFMMIKTGDQETNIEELFAGIDKIKELLEKEGD